ncbi:MAG: glycoside hydrolase family 30 beta sandwich domain-containing protein [Acidobacteriaceae bacterium]
MRFRIVSALAVMFASALPLVAQHRSGKAVLWLSSADRAPVFARERQALHFKKGVAVTPVITVDDAKAFQAIDGFGFALTGGSAQLMMQMSPVARRALIRETFGLGNGDIGVSYLRVSIGSSDMNDHAFTYDDLKPGETDPALAKFGFGPDLTTVIPVLKEILAANPRIRILGSPWSAPAWMKTNDNLKGGTLKREYDRLYAQYFVKYIEGMKAHGITIDAVTPQNEPRNPGNTPSMVLTAQQEADFVANDLGPAFRHAGITTRIVIYDHNCDRPDYPLTVLNNAQARQYVDGTGFHLYAGAITALTTVHNAYPEKNIYFTEQMVVDGPDKSKLDIASPEARIVIGATRNWSRNVLLWNLAANPEFGPHTNNGGCPVCEGAVTLDGNQVTRNVAYYVVAHASKFVRPGSVRIASTAADSLANVAFKTPKGRIVLIVSNDSDTAETFAIRYRGREAVSTLNAGAVGTYVW